MLSRINEKRSIIRTTKKERSKFNRSDYEAKLYIKANNWIKNRMYKVTMIKTIWYIQRFHYWEESLKN